MNSPAPEVVSPVVAQADGLAKIVSFIKAHELRTGSTPTPTYFLSGAAEHDQVELTEQVHVLLTRVVSALSAGKSISIVTRDEEISTQQAAELLGISRPTLIGLIDAGEIAAHIPGARRRKLRLADVLAYREELRARRNEFITEFSDEYDDSDVDADEVQLLLSEARTVC